MTKIPPELEDALETGLEQLELSLDADVRQTLLEYLALVLQADRAMNLIGRVRGRAAVEALICDSLVPLTLDVELASPLLDVGSGAGLPGIPLAIATADSRSGADDGLDVTLLEPRDRRFRFLGHAIRTLGLEHTRRVRGRIEPPDEGSELSSSEPEVLAALADLEIDPERDRPSTVVSKAVFELPTWLRLGAALVAPGGLVIAMCSASDWDAMMADGGVGSELDVIDLRTLRWAGGNARVCAGLRRSPESGVRSREDVGTDGVG